MNAKIKEKSELSKLLSIKTRISGDLFYHIGEFCIGCRVNQQVQNYNILL